MFDSAEMFWQGFAKHFYFTCDITSDLGVFNYSKYYHKTKFTSNV